MRIQSASAHSAGPRFEVYGVWVLGKLRKTLMWISSKSMPKSTPNRFNKFWEFYQKSQKHQLKYVQNGAKIGPKSSQNLWNCDLEAFWAAGRAQDGSGEPGAGTQWADKSILGPKMSLQGSILGLLKSENGSKISLLRLDGHSGPPKMTAGGGFRKNMKN